MKREILFRGKRIDNGEWAQGRSILQCIDSTDESKRIYRILATGEKIASVTNYCGNIAAMIVEWVKVDPDTVGQFTGLTDKNGQRIFEGDIVEVNDSYNPLKFAGCVEFKDASFCITEQGVGGHYRWIDYECTVSGNIYDNPEVQS